MVAATRPWSFFFGEAIELLETVCKTYNVIPSFFKECQLMINPPGKVHSQFKTVKNAYKYANPEQMKRM